MLISYQIMTAPQKEPRKTASTNPMAGTWTKAAKVRRRFKAGRQRTTDLVLTLERSMFEGYILLRDIQQAMSGEGLPETDVQAALVLLADDSAGTDFINVVPIPEVKQMLTLKDKLDKLEKKSCWTPLGVAIKQRDREAEANDPKNPRSGAVVWVQPWLTNPRAARALIQARTAFAEHREGQITF